MTDNTILGLIAQGIFTVSTGAQALRCHKQGHAYGVSSPMILGLCTGLIIMLYYIYFELNCDIVLISGHSIQLGFWLIIARYRFWGK